jgi:Protein of unknown function (DUF2934)
MNKPVEINIVRRAYELWQQAGEPEGKDHEFYHLAECELKAGTANGKDPSHRTPDNL